MRLADEIRNHVRRKYIEPARRRGDSTVEVLSGRVLEELRLSNGQAPSVCGALKAPKFRSDNRLVLEKLDGPPKKMSTTVVFTFRLLDNNSGDEQAAIDAAFLRARGIAKDAFKRLGGGEAFIKHEREHFYDAG